MNSGMGFFDKLLFDKKKFPPSTSGFLNEAIALRLKKQVYY